MGCVVVDMQFVVAGTSQLGINKTAGHSVLALCDHRSGKKHSQLL